MDFETKIHELIKQGKSFTEISEQFDNALNAVMVADSENELDHIYHDALDSLLAASTDGAKFTKDVVINAAVCWAVETHDDWGKDEIDMLKGTLETVLDITEAGITNIKPLLDKKQAREKEKGTTCPSQGRSDEDILTAFLSRL